jgi:hypothetical protein
VACEGVNGTNVVDLWVTNGQQPTFASTLICILIKSCVFDECKSSSYGGAIYIYSTTTETVAVIDSSFSSCSTVGYYDGGAIYLHVAAEIGNGVQLEGNFGSGCSSGVGGWLFLSASNLAATNTFQPKISCGGVFACTATYYGAAVMIEPNRFDATEIHQTNFTKCASDCDCSIYFLGGNYASRGQTVVSECTLVVSEPSVSLCCIYLEVLWGSWKINWTNFLAVSSSFTPSGSLSSATAGAVLVEWIETLGLVENCVFIVGENRLLSIESTTSYMTTRGTTFIGVCFDTSDWYVRGTVST